MPWKRFKTEVIISKLREAKVVIAQGKAIPQACRQIGVTAQTYYRWRKEYTTVRLHSGLGYRPPAPEVRLAGPALNGKKRLRLSLKPAIAVTYTLVAGLGAGSVSY